MCSMSLISTFWVFSAPVTFFLPLGESLLVTRQCRASRQLVPDVSRWFRSPFFAIATRLENFDCPEVSSSHRARTYVESRKDRWIDRRCKTCWPTASNFGLVKLKDFAGQRGFRRTSLLRLRVSVAPRFASRDKKRGRVRSNSGKTSARRTSVWDFNRASDSTDASRPASTHRNARYTVIDRTKFIREFYQHRPTVTFSLEDWSFGRWKDWWLQLLKL